MIPERVYRSLESNESRRALVEEIKKVRQQALVLVELVPQEQWYEPNFQGWSLAFILAHLNMMDDLTLQMMQSALRGFTVPLPKSFLNRFNAVTSRLFRRRTIKGTLEEIRRKEPRVLNFVLKLPTNQMQRRVYDPWLERYLTVEQAVQEFLLIHWEMHIQPVLDAYDKGFYEPTAVATDKV